MNLLQANTQSHERQENTINLMLMALTELNIETALKHFKDFETDLSQHMQAEEQHIQPLIKQHENNLARQVEGDHKILLKFVAKCDAFLHKLHQTPLAEQRLLMVQNLDAFIRLRAILEHHTIRENELVYNQDLFHKHPDIDQLANQLC
ncbi:MAG: hypothetical protein ACWA5R_10065 [bacterium]